MANRVQIPARKSALHDHRRETTVKQVEDAFREFTNREDVAIVLISQYVILIKNLEMSIPYSPALVTRSASHLQYCGCRVANMIRFLVDSYSKPVPAIFEIPSKDHPYDPAQDSVLSRV